MEIEGIKQRCTVDLPAVLMPPALQHSYSRVVCTREWQHGGKHHGSRYIAPLGCDIVWNWR